MVLFHKITHYDTGKGEFLKDRKCFLHINSNINTLSVFEISDDRLVVSMEQSTDMHNATAHLIISEIEHRAQLLHYYAEYAKNMCNNVWSFILTVSKQHTKTVRAFSKVYLHVRYQKMFCSWFTPVGLHFGHAHCHPLRQKYLSTMIHHLRFLAMMSMLILTP